jgi:hypothetical protein
MLTRTINIACLLLVLCVSCTSVPHQVDSVTGSEAAAIQSFLNVTPDDMVNTTNLKDAYGDYIIIYSKDYKNGIVLDVESTDHGSWVVRNVAFGTRLPSGDWDLFGKDQSENKYEIQGGVWTIQHFADLLAKGLTSHPRSIRLNAIVRNN